MITSDLVNIEYKGKTFYPKFKQSVLDKKVMLICDENTEIFADEIYYWLLNFSSKVDKFVFKKAFIPNEKAINEAMKVLIDFDYLLAVGSGTLNDLTKYLGKLLSIPTGVLATAPSMDGYLSTGSALLFDGMKLTKYVDMPKDILIDLDILVSSPKDMIAAGYGDILGKYTSLADWELSCIINGEEINKESYEMMRESLNKTVYNLENNDPFSRTSIENLIDALNVAGIAMAIAGNSRPASGSEHHMSHFLEVFFLENNMPAIYHGYKVALGSLVSIFLYNNLLQKTVNLDIIKLIQTLPDMEHVYKLLSLINAPLKYIDINVDKDLFKKMLLQSHTMRDRYTILSFYNHNNLMPLLVEELVDKFIG